jgi:hypothetical protein
LWVAQFVQCDADVTIDGEPVRVRLETRYPWHGDVRITLTPREPRELTLRVRVPGFARGEPLPGGLYRFADAVEGAAAALRVDNAPAPLVVRDGFASITRRFEAGDSVHLTLPMPVRRVVCDERVVTNRGLVALQRGPIVYCFEGIDQPDPEVGSFVLDDEAELTSAFEPELLGGVATVRTRTTVVRRELDGGIAPGEPFAARAIPYFAWANRGRTPMAVWLARTQDAATPQPAPTLARRARASSSFGKDLEALSDQVEPARSNDHAHPFVHWWPRKGTTESLTYELDAPAELEGVDVYWFEDEGRGECRVPAAWRCLVRVGGAWREVEAPSGYGTAKDAWQRCTFTPMRCDAVRLEVTAREGFAGGLHEWRLRGAR